MNQKLTDIRNILRGIVNRQKSDLTEFVTNPKTNLSRNRKILYDKLILSLSTMERTSLTNELLRQSGCDMNIATSSAFVQQRKTLRSEGMEQLFQSFTFATNNSVTYKEYRLLAIDGSDIQIPTNLDASDSLFQTKERRPYNLLHLNAFYDIMTHTYIDTVVAKLKVLAENKALTEMVDRSTLSEKIRVIADRGYSANQKKEEYILQEIFAKLIMHNFSELITSHVVLEKRNRKYEYKVNFSVAAHICREFFRKMYSI